MPGGHRDVRHLHPGAARTPRRTVMAPSASRMRNASRRVGRETPNCSISTLSEGS